MNHGSLLEGLFRASGSAGGLLSSLNAALNSDPEGARLFSDLLKGGDLGALSRRAGLSGGDRASDANPFGSSEDKVPLVFVNLLHRLGVQAVPRPAVHHGPTTAGDTGTGSETVDDLAAEEGAETAPDVAEMADTDIPIHIDAMAAEEPQTLLDILVALRATIEWIEQKLHPGGASKCHALPVDGDAIGNDVALEKTSDIAWHRGLRDFWLLFRQVREAEPEVDGSAETVRNFSAPDDAAPEDKASYDALAEIFVGLAILARLVEKRLHFGAPDENTVDGVAQIPADPDLAAVNDQLVADIRELLKKLQAHGLGPDAETAGPAPVDAVSEESVPLPATPELPADTVEIEGDLFLEDTASGTSTASTPVSASTVKKEGAVTAPVDLSDVQEEFRSLFHTVFQHLFEPRGTPGAGFVPAAAAAMARLGGQGLDLDFGFGHDRAGSSGASGTTQASSGNIWLPVNDGTVAPYSFASQLSAARALHGGAIGLPGPVEQVVLKIGRNLRSGDDQMTIQLRPAELGRIHIKLAIAADGKVQGTVVADNPVTLDLLLKDVRSLERALQEAGLRADSGSLQFSLSGQSGNPFGKMAGDAEAHGNNIPSDSALAADETTPDPIESWYLTPGRINMKV